MDDCDGATAVVVQTVVFILPKVKLNHSCILSVTVERLFVFFLFLSLFPFVFLYFIAFLLSLIDHSCDCIRNSSAVGEHEDPHSLARHLHNIGLVCISVWLHPGLPERIPKALMYIRYMLLRLVHSRRGHGCLYYCTLMIWNIWSYEPAVIMLDLAWEESHAEVPMIISGKGFLAHTTNLPTR